MTSTAAKPCPAASSRKRSRNRTRRVDGAVSAEEGCRLRHQRPLQTVHEQADRRDGTNRQQQGRQQQPQLSGAPIASRETDDQRQGHGMAAR